MKTSLYLFIALLLLCGGCEKALPGFAEEWHGVQFILDGEYNATLNDRVKSNYSFYGKDAALTQDTVWLRVRPQGALPQRTSYLRFEQFQEIRWDYKYDELGHVIDSTLYEYPDQAEPGVHYVAFDDARVAGLMKLEEGELEARIPVIVLRSPSLQEKPYTLNFRIVDSDDLSAGDSHYCQAQIVISDCLVQPINWSWRFGTWSVVRYDFMNRVTGIFWDDDFITSVNSNAELLSYYIYVFKRELAKENAARAEEGLPPLRDDPNDPSTEIVFN